MGRNRQLSEKSDFFLETLVTPDGQKRENISNSNLTKEREVLSKKDAL